MKFTHENYTYGIGTFSHMKFPHMKLTHGTGTFSHMKFTHETCTYGIGTFSHMKFPYMELEPFHIWNFHIWISHTWNLHIWNCNLFIYEIDMKICEISQMTSTSENLHNIKFGHSIKIQLMEMCDNSSTELIIIFFFIQDTHFTEVFFSGVLQKLCTSYTCIVEC